MAPPLRYDTIGPWLIERKLGEGGMAAVLLCRHSEIPGLRAAVKRLPAWSADVDAIARFDREADALRLLHHPHIVPLIEGVDAAGRDPASGACWLAMAWVPGPTLEKRLDSGPLDPEELLAVMIPLTHALEHAHSRGVFHRDVKPSNIILGDRGVQLVDFGVALLAELSRMTGSGIRAGTLAYLPPEALDDQQRAEPAAGDLYALGVVLYEALTATRAFAPLAPTPALRDMEILRAKHTTGALDPGPTCPEPWRQAVRLLTSPTPSARLRDFSIVRQLLWLGMPNAEAPVAERPPTEEPAWSEGPTRPTPRPSRPDRARRSSRRLLPGVRTPIVEEEEDPFSTGPAMPLPPELRGGHDPFPVHDGARSRTSGPTTEAQREQSGCMGSPSGEASGRLSESESVGDAAPGVAEPRGDRVARHVPRTPSPPADPPASKPPTPPTQPVPEALLLPPEPRVPLLPPEPPAPPPSPKPQVPPPVVPSPAQPTISQVQPTPSATLDPPVIPPKASTAPRITRLPPKVARVQPSAIDDDHNVRLAIRIGTTLLALGFLLFSATAALVLLRGSQADVPPQAVVEQTTIKTPPPIDEIWHDTGIHLAPLEWPNLPSKRVTSGPNPAKTPPPLAGRRISIRMTDDSSAELLIDGRRVGTTPWSGKLPYGSHPVRVKTSKREITGSIPVSADGASRFEVDPLYSRIIHRQEI